jgi:hypothetical protein
LQQLMLLPSFDAIVAEAASFGVEAGSFRYVT